MCGIFRKGVLSLAARPPLASYGYPLPRVQYVPVLFVVFVIFLLRFLGFGGHSFLDRAVVRGIRVFLAFGSGVIRFFGAFFSWAVFGYSGEDANKQNCRPRC